MDPNAVLPGQSEPADNTPLIPLPNPGEGGPVFPGADEEGLPPTMPGTPSTGPQRPVPGTPSTGTQPSVPSTPSTRPQRPVPSTPSIGSGGTNVIAPLPDNTVPTRYAAVRFLNATHGYPAFRIFVDGTRVVNLLNPASASGYVRVPAGLRRIAVAGQDGYVYIAKELPFVSGSTSTVAIINRTGGLELAQIADACRVI